MSRDRVVAGQWEKYAEQAAEIAYSAGAPVWPWSRLTTDEHEPRIARMRAVLATVGPLIAEDTRERMVAAAGAALEREPMSGDLRAALKRLCVDLEEYSDSITAVTLRALLAAHQAPPMRKVEQP